MPKQKTAQKSDELRRKELEEHEPGASREEVLAMLERTAQPTKDESPRRSKKPEK
jgi:hypothetical protein